MTFKRICAVFVSVFCLAVQLACRPTGDQKSDSQQESNAISFRITWTDYSGRGQAIQKIVDQYNQLSEDDAMIQMVGGDEDEDTVRSLLEAEPETVFVLPYRYVQYFGNLGFLSDLSADFIDETDLFYPEVWALGTTNGSTYGIPWLGHSMCLLYNDTLLKEADVDPATIDSLNSLLSAMEKIEEQTERKRHRPGRGGQQRHIVDGQSVYLWLWRETGQ